VEGYAERIEYNEREDTVKLTTRARVRLLENEIQRDELRGDAITYDQRNAKYFVTGGKPSADPNNPDGRVRGTIAPRSDTPPETANSGSKASLTPSKDLANPRRE
jgi:lipopolysaccharide export system protein LptA